VVANAHELVALPARGRRYVVSRRVHLGDVDGHGRLRLEAVARYLQDIATDDGDEAGIGAMGAWVVRRSVAEIGALPRYHEDVEMTTWCSGTGPRWAERRTTITGGGRVLVEAATIWVLLDGVRGRPLPLAEGFFPIYGESAEGRRVSSKLFHALPPAGLPGREWALRETDFDVYDHVNNARYWEAVEDEMARRLPGSSVVGTEVEFRGSVQRGDDVALVSDMHQSEAPGLSVWLLVDGDVRMSAVVTVKPRPG
jgi:acyl-ACP thioesterase